jgi:ABC-type nitrate/sulfonate/bicarbonate transport system permease component
MKTPHAASDDPATQAVVRRTLATQRRLGFMRVVLGLGFPLALFLIWEILARTGIVDQRFFPPPSRIVATAVETLGNATERGQLASDILVTLARLSVGYVLGAIIGILAGVLMGLYTPIRFALGPLVYATFPTPKIAIFPLLIVIFGIGNASKTALVTLGVFFMTCMSTLSGVLYANPIYKDVAQAFRLPTWTRWTRVIIPSALPAIVTGLKLGLGQALILVVSAEFVSSQDGLGHFIWNSWQVLDIPRMFMGLVVVGIIGGCAVLAGDMLERRLIPWAKH